ncbi:MAG: hypothetical protein ACJAQT_001551 [Akkermansiaceae bacterium]|jgi:hypothetical protein
MLSPACQADLFTNGDFEDAGTTWFEAFGGGTFTFDYPTTGGNDDGFGVINHTVGSEGFGIWVGYDGDPISLAELGLTAETTYNFTQDMKILAGSNVGGFKLDFTNGGDPAGTTGDLRKALIGDGSTWETYTFEIDIPAGVDGFKVVPLWGIDSSVGFDNLGFDPTPVEPPVEPPVVELTSEPQFTKGTLVTWIPSNAEKIHQPQSSQDGTTWSDLGPAFLGTDTTTILDPDSAPFYRVQERDPAGEQALINGDFEVADAGNPDCPENWACLSTSGQLPTRIETDSYSGSASVRLALQNDDSGSPNQAEMQQNLGNAGGFVTGGETYTFSFWAKQISFGVSYVQNYRLQWIDGGGAPINGADVGFNSFTGGNGSWQEVSAPNLVAPAQATGVFIQIFGATGAVAGVDAKGEVLIDDIRLAIGGATAPTVLATTTELGIGITQLVKTGVTYKAQQSEDLQNFSDLSGTFTGNGQVAGAGIPDGGPSHFFRILEIAEEAN